MGKPKWGKWANDHDGAQPDTQIVGYACAGNAGSVFHRLQLQRNPLVSDPSMHHGTCVTHVPSCMPGTLTHVGGKNVPGIPGATRNVAYLVRGQGRIYGGRGWGVFHDYEYIFKYDYYSIYICISNTKSIFEIRFYPSALRAGGVLSSRSGRAAGWAAGRAAAKLAEPISL